MTRKLVVAAMAVVVVAFFIPIVSAQEETPVTPIQEVTPAPAAPAPVMHPTVLVHEKKLLLSKGTMQVGGEIAFTHVSAFGDSGGTSSAFAFVLSPTVGYFILDNVELLGQFSFGMAGDYDGNIPQKLVSFALGVRDVLDAGWVVNPFFGVLLGMSFSIPDQEDTTKSLDLQVPFGVLIPLNQHVAINLGIKFQYSRNLDTSVNVIQLPIGYFGVEGFF
jgi:hypothetical protein